MTKCIDLRERKNTNKKKTIEFKRCWSVPDLPIEPVMSDPEDYDTIVCLMDWEGGQLMLAYWNDGVVE